MPVIILYNHTNLYYFMITKELTQRQVRQAELLSVYDFVIKYCLELRNPINILSYYFNYLEKDINTRTLLPILQEKLQRGIYSTYN